jgi:hypothetical protein
MKNAQQGNLTVSDGKDTSSVSGVGDAERGGVGPMYMDGRGVMARTRKLTNRMWDQLLNVILGWSLMLCGPLLFWAVFISHMPWEAPPDVADKIIFCFGTACSIIAGGLLARPWHMAVRELKRHTAAMERETELRGNGWAES